MAISDDIWEIFDLSKVIFGEKNCEIVQKDSLSDKIKIDYPSHEESSFVANVYLDKLFWGEEVVVIEVLNTNQFIGDEPFLFHLDKNMNFETKWFFPIGRRIENVVAFSEFVLTWLEEYLKSEKLKLDIYKKYIDIRVDPLKQLRDWKLRKFL